MIKLYILILLSALFFCKPSNSQIVADTFYIPPYPVPEIYYTDDAPELPENVWNHKLKYFPPWRYDQYSLSNCGQASSTYYCLSYEFNRALNQVADSTSIFSPTWSYNFLSEGDGWFGVSAFNSWNLIKSQGNPVLNVFNEWLSEDTTFIGVYHGQYWMNGYDKYYSSFHNRISDYYSLNVSTDEDLKILMHYLDDHLRGDSTGGTVIFYSNAYFMHTGAEPLIYDSTLCYPNDKAKVIDYITGEPTHSLTIAGYYNNTSIDFNDDGLITDSLDINNDGKIDRHDNEKILWIVINSYGDDWPYSMFLFKYDLPNRFWNKQVFLPVPDTEYKPELCFKIRIKHKCRNSLKIYAGISTDLESDYPEKILDFPIFNYQGGQHVMTGRDTVPGADLIELGINVSDILKHIETNGDTKVFLIIENSGGTEGELEYFSVMNYQNSSILENVGISENIIIPAASVSYFPAFTSLYSEPEDTILKLDSPDYNIAKTGNILNVDLAATGGKPSYTFKIIKTNEYQQEYSIENYDEPDYLSFTNNSLTALAPGWKTPYADELWDSIYISNNATISFSGKNKPAAKVYPYPSIITSDYRDLQIDIFDGYYKQKNVSYDFEITDSCINIYFNDMLEREFLCKATIYRDGRIKLIYDNVENYYLRTAGLKTFTGTYYSGLCTPGVSLNKNTVLFTPVNADYPATISQDGILNITQTNHTGEGNIYVSVIDANGHKANKRVNYEIINSEAIGTIYPNPFIENAYLELITKNYDLAQIAIFNISGQKVAEYNEDLAPGTNNVRIASKSQSFAAGVYTCVIKIGDTVEKLRMIAL